MPDAAPIVFVVDDDISVRESLESLIQSEGFRVETFPSADEFLARPRSTSPSCLVLDLTLPGLDGLELQKRIAGERREMPIIFISGYGDVPKTARAMKAGAVEFLTKPLNSEELLSAIRQALERSELLLDHQREVEHFKECLASLTPREREVMDLVVAGLLNKQVGSKLGISEITVKAHRGKVMAKMQAESIADLVRISERFLFVTTPSGRPHQSSEV